MILSSPVYRIFKADGTTPSPGAKLYTYLAGTTTPSVVYTNSGLTVAAANPVIMSASGEATLYLGNRAYKFVEKDANDVTIRTIDNIQGSYLTSESADLSFADLNTPIRAGTVTSAVASSIRTFAVTLNPAITSYTDNMRITFAPNAATGTEDAFKINVNSVGAVPLYDAYGQNIPPAALAVGVQYDCIYSAANTAFIVQGVTSAFVEVASSENAHRRVIAAVATALPDQLFIAVEGLGITRTHVPSDVADTSRWVEMNANDPVTLTLKTQTVSTAVTTSLPLVVSNIYELI